MTSPPPSPTLRSLAATGQGAPTARKILVAPTLIWGREVLRTLARQTGGWIGWEPVTLRSLADQLALVSLSESATRIGTDIEIGALIGKALDDATAAGELPTAWQSLAANDGCRTAIRDGVLELRMAGVSTQQIIDTRSTDAITGLAAVLQRFTALLDTHHVADAAAVFATALATFDTEAPFVLDHHVILAMDLETRGFPGRLLQRITDRGATTLESAKSGVSAAETTFFVAATPSDEVREALRRAITEGYKLDEIEFVTTDPDTYGTALDALCQQLNVHLTLQEGLPYQRSRIGRAISRMLDWLEQGLPADLLREALEAGDITAPTRHDNAPLDGALLAHALRSLRIGWGRARYESAIESLTNGSWISPKAERWQPRDEAVDPTAVALRVETAAQLAALLQQLLADEPVARLALRFLDLMPLRHPTDTFNVERLRGRLQQLAEVDQPTRPLASPLGEIRQLLADFRVWTDLDPAGQVRLSRSGALHLADMRHAGVTGRPRVFFLGLDDDRTAGPRTPDPLLPDTFREKFPDLATAAERRIERRKLLDRAVAEPPGRITISYAQSGEKGRAAGPAPLLLDVARHVWSAPTLDYTTLLTRLGAPACAVPSAALTPLDRRDVWLAALGAGPTLLDGAAAVRRACQGLDAGIAAIDTLTDQEVGPTHGLVVTAAGHVDPTKAGGRVVSASSLELLSKCPLAWFYKYVLRIEPPDDPEFDAELWLDPKQRGSLLHAVFEEFVGSYREQPDKLPTDQAVTDINAMCDRHLAEQRADAPPPSESIFLAERDEIVRAARSFLEMERGLFRRTGTVSWLETEIELAGNDAVVALPDGTSFRLHGFIDRIDAIGDDARMIIDYKTGSTYAYARDHKAGPLNGGRLLQPALYSAAYTAKSGRKVERFEYRFPTVKGKNGTVALGETELAAGRALVPGVIQPLRTGAFLPTTDPDDCKFCDFRDLCHVSGGEDIFNPVQSPRAAWAADMPESEPHLMPMRARRTKP